MNNINNKDNKDKILISLNDKDYINNNKYIKSKVINLNKFNNSNNINNNTNSNINNLIINSDNKINNINNINNSINTDNTLAFNIDIDFEDDTNIVNPEDNTNCKKEKKIDNILNAADVQYSIAASDQSKNNINKTSIQRKKQIRTLKLEKLNPEQIVNALQKSNGLIGQAADILGVERATLSRYIKRFPNDDISEAIFQGRQRFIDKCEQRLEYHVENNDPRISLDAVKFALSTIGKERGYTTSTSLEIDANISAVAPDISKIAEAAARLENVIDIEAEEE